MYDDNNDVDTMIDSSQTPNKSDVYARSFTSSTNHSAKKNNLSQPIMNQQRTKHTLIVNKFSNEHSNKYFAFHQKWIWNVIS